MHFKLELRADTVGEIIDGLKEVQRRLKLELIMRTGSNRYETDKLKPFKIEYPSREYPFIFEVGNRKKKP